MVLVDIAPKFESAGARRITDFMRARPDGFESLEEVADAIAAYNPNRRLLKDLRGLKKNLRRALSGRYHWHFDPRMIPPVDGLADREAAMEEAARALDVPTLLVRGKMSDLVTEESVKHFLELVPHAHYAGVASAGHMVAGDENDLFTTTVADFLNREVRR